MAEAVSPLGQEKISRRMFIAERITDHLMRVHGGRVPMIEGLKAQAAVQLTAEEHSEWDMDGDLRTRDQWERADDWPLEKDQAGS